MRSAIVLLAVVSVIVLGSAATTFAQRSSGADRPPGVTADQWVRISDVAGVVLTDDVMPTRFTLPPGVALPQQRIREGILMVNHNNNWIAFERLGALTPRVHPLN